MALRSLSTAALRKEIARREKGAKKFIAKHAKLSKVLASLERTLEDLGVGAMSLSGGTGKRRGRPPGSKNKTPGRKPGRKARGKRPKNKLNLGDSLAAAIKTGSTVSPAEAIQRVKSAGYKTTSKAFNVSVSQTLAKDKRFKRTGRGQYQRVAG